MPVTPSWKMLTEAITFYLKENPAMHTELLKFVRDQGHAPGSLLPEGCHVMTDAQVWYETVRDYGQGRHVSVHDIPELRAFGYGIYDPDTKTTHHFYVNVNSFDRSFPVKLRKMFQNEKTRREFAQLVSQGKAPDLSQG